MVLVVEERRHQNPRKSPDARPTKDSRMAECEIVGAVRAAAKRGRVVLAVSGGRDSMVLLDAMARFATGAVAAVATFDHATGPAATRAVAMVRARGRSLGLRVVSARARSAGRNEAELRDARWSFLKSASARFDAPVATAHTRDDQLETILMRVLRGSGARGLAGLCAPSRIVRPLLGITRAKVTDYALQQGVSWIEDPSNASAGYLRNRVRRDLLPALLSVAPSLGDDLLEIGERAAALREALEEVVDAMRITLDAEGALNVATASLSGYDPRELRTVWPVIAARSGVTLDRRGTERLARFTMDAGVGDRMQLSGGVEVVRRRSAIALAGTREDVAPPTALEDGTVWGGWRFRIEQAVPDRSTSGGAMPPFTALLDAQSGLRIRAWTPGDRMRAAGDAVPRRVKRFLRDAGLAGPDRRGWPVVLAGEEIVWIPGVRRSDAATIRPGRPGALYVCDRIQQHRIS
jgi:tRNA(Ile)-lysidine synthase